MRFIGAFLLTLFSLSLYAEKVETELESADYQIGTFQPNSKIEVGMTGFVEREFKYGFSSILAYATVVEKNRVEFSEFDLLEQDSLPKGLWKPEAGDRLVFKSDYRRALIVAPNRENYLEIEKAVNKDIVHPDIFTATLQSMGQVRPLKEDFRYICQQHHIGVLYINYDNIVEEKDCLSGKTLKKLSIQLPTDSDIQKPFYSRIKQISGDLFGSGTDEFKEYNKYYRELF